MSRATGRKHGPRQPVIEPGTPAGDDIGLSARRSPSGSPIPGKDLHVINPAVTYVEPATGPDKPPFRGIMAHGVPPELTEHHAAGDTRGHETQRHRTKAAKDPEPRPVPVYLAASPETGENPLRRVVVRKLTLPVVGVSDPVQIVGEDATIIEVLILNEDSTHHGRFSGELSNLASGQGAIIPKAATSYTKLVGQNTLYAVSDDSGNPVISVVITYDASKGQFRGK